MRRSRPNESELIRQSTTGLKLNPNLWLDEQSNDSYLVSEWILCAGAERADEYVPAKVNSSRRLCEFAAGLVRQNGGF